MNYPVWDNPNINNIEIELLPGGKMPTKAHKTDAAYDIYSAQDITLPPFQSSQYGRPDLVKAGFKLKIPEGFKANILPRSGFSLKQGVMIANSPGTIDQDYREEVGIIMLNLSQLPVYIYKGDRIAQMDFQRVYQTKFVRVEEVKREEDSRSGGFGSTGTS